MFTDLDVHVREWARGRHDRIRKRYNAIRGVQYRKPRQHTTTVVIHRIGSPKSVVGTSFESIERFFTADPEGVATVTMRGSWASKKPRFEKWWEAGSIPPNRYRENAPTMIPVYHHDRAFVPYHFGIDRSAYCQWLPWDVAGAHAAGHNSRSIGVAIVNPSDALTEIQRRSLADMLTYIYLRHGGILDTITHDEANRKRGLPPKGCPGVEVSDVVGWAQNRAHIMLNR